MEFVVQGDMALIRRDAPPAHLLRRKSRVLLHGEVTGHVHEVISEDKMEVFEDPASQTLWVHVMGTATLQHTKEGTPTGDHKPISLSAGWYEMRRQNEVFQGIRRFVAD